MFEGEPANVKLTLETDFASAERRLGASGGNWIMRVGSGFDVHAFADGDHVWLGGRADPAERGVLAHSDGDVVLHALTDAVLGALAEGDIGDVFPAERSAMARRVVRALPRLRGRARQGERAGVIDHLDATVLCEEPRIGPHRELMRATIAAIARVPLGAVSVKATTTEKLGFIGRGEGIAAQAVATIRLPPERA